MPVALGVTFTKTSSSESVSQAIRKGLTRVGCFSIKFCITPVLLDENSGIARRYALVALLN